MENTDHDLVLDSSIRDWVLIPIMIIMVLIGILRHHVAFLMSTQRKLNTKSIREA